MGRVWSQNKEPRDVYMNMFTIYRVDSSHISGVDASTGLRLSLQWSYGVVVWELLTRGCLPYPDVDSFNIRNFVVKGHRMAQPRQSPDDM